MTKEPSPTEYERIKIKGLCFLGHIEEIGDGGPNENPRIVLRDNYGNQVVFDCDEDDCKKLGHKLYTDVTVKFDAVFEYINTIPNI